MASTLYEQCLQLIIKELDKDARTVLEECVNERTYQHQTYNLYDSYGYGIYVKGKLVKTGYLSASPTATESKKWYGETIRGREEIEDYLKNGYSPSGAIDLAVAAAMPYAKVLEAGGGGISRKYKVISMSFQKLQALAHKYGGTVKIIR